VLAWVTISVGWENMHVKRLILENYRCFDNLDIVFDDRVTVIVGPNASGKTSILDSLSIFLSLLTILTKRIGILTKSFKNDDLRKNSKFDYIKYRIEFDVHSFECIINANCDGILNVLHNDYIKLVQSIEQSQQKFPILVCYSSDRSFNSVDIKLINDEYEIDEKASYKNGFMPKIDFLSTLKWFKSLDILEANQVRATRDVNFRLPELQAVREVISKVLNDQYDSPCLDTSGRELVLRAKNTDYFYRLSQLSHGIQSVLSLTIDLARRMAQADGEQNHDSVLATPAIVMIDELDLHLHPSWQQTILPNLLEAFPCTQFIVTTQSPLVAASVPPPKLRILGANGSVRVPAIEVWGDHGQVMEVVFGSAPVEMGLNPF
jgi:predicted ATP-binding protein involved in virulence